MSKGKKFFFFLKYSKNLPKKLTLFNLLLNFLKVESKVLTKILVSLKKKFLLNISSPGKFVKRDGRIFCHLYNSF